MNVREEILKLADAPNAEFMAPLVPGVPVGTILGARMPRLRDLAKALRGTPEAEQFMRELPHKFFDENNLHALLIGQLRDYDAVLAELERFLPYVDNWATCDAIRPAVIKKHTEKFERVIDGCLDSGAPFTQRFGIEMLMCFYLDGAFRPEQLARVAAVSSEHYYVRMMQAWYFATALAKQYDSALPYIEQRRLEPRTHRKTIQKAIESYRISDGKKALLRSLK